MPDKQRIKAFVIGFVYRLKKLMFPGMMAPVHAGEGIGHDVRVADRAFNVAVTEQFLDVADTGPVFQQVRGRRVPDRMGGYLLPVHVEAAQQGAEAFADTGRCDMPAFTRSGIAPENPFIRA